jgi:eukaryotic-like serine/threonine-protein kinase
MLLRSYLETRRALPFREVVQLLTPLCEELARRLETGERFYLHPSNVELAGDSLVLAQPTVAPLAIVDAACQPPEAAQSGQPLDTRGAVYAIGAMLYEMCTGHAFGRGIGTQPPRSLVPSLPEQLDTLLAVALRANAAERPADVRALASALNALVTTGSLAPADGVDISFSAPPPAMDPTFSAPPIAAPPQSAAAARPMAFDPFGGAPSAPNSGAQVAPAAASQAQVLGALKQRLEADPNPRYVVIKDGMDHGPFNAVELLQQIASHTFTPTDLLRDERVGETRAINEWPDFAAFAHHAQLGREVVAEKKAVVQLERSERKSGAAKVLLGASVAAAVLAGAGFYIYKSRGERTEGRNIGEDPAAFALEMDGGLRGGKKAGSRGAGGGPAGTGGGGGGAYSRGGMSYEGALSSNTEEVKMGGGGGPDLTNAQLAGPMANAAFVSGCGAPDSMKVTVRVAIKMGTAVGVSVYPNPPDGAVASCVDRHVRGIRWPANAKMDSFTTTY